MEYREDLIQAFGDGSLMYINVPWREWDIKESRRQQGELCRGET